MKLSINKWAEEDRPREKLENIGAENLSDAELLAILIGSGNTEKSAVDLMREVMQDCNNNLNTLGKMSIPDLTKYNGIGPAKAITVIAACELGRRRQLANVEERQQFSNAGIVYEFMLPKMQDLQIEEFHAIFMNHNLKLIKTMRLSKGGITNAMIDIRLLMKEAILCNATVMTICHNHPSGKIMPSRNDDQLTESVRNACKVMNIQLLDHVIVTDGDYFSYHEEGKL